VRDGKAKSRKSEESERWRSKEQRVREPEGAESQYRMKLVSSKLNQELELNQLLHYKHQLPISYMITLTTLFPLIISDALWHDMSNSC